MLDQVLDEVLQGVVSAPTANSALPSAQEADADTDDMQSRLEKLKA